MIVPHIAVALNAVATAPTYKHGRGGGAQVYLTSALWLVEYDARAGVTQDRNISNQFTLSMARRTHTHPMLFAQLVTKTLTTIDLQL